MTLEIKEIAKPLQIWSYLIIVYNSILLKASLNRPFAVFNKRAKLWSKIISKRLPWLVKTEKALRSFRESVDKIGGIEGLYIIIREVVNRSPSGYITEIRVIILDSNRELEYRIYGAFAELLGASIPLLFDLHIIKRRGRRLEDVIPKGFWRYE